MILLTYLIPVPTLVVYLFFCVEDFTPWRFPDFACRFFLGILQFDNEKNVRSLPYGFHNPQDFLLWGTDYTSRIPCSSLAIFSFRIFATGGLDESPFFRGAGFFNLFCGMEYDFEKIGYGTGFQLHLFKSAFYIDRVCRTA